ncbi:MAG TPA: type II secretion system F family protein [Polyangia bacterium]|jgi:tight adherence protein C|nr:type II secretion system F family protein [Polyangia bacterium]
MNIDLLVAGVASMVFVIAVALGLRSLFTRRNRVVERLVRGGDRMSDEANGAPALADGGDVSAAFSKLLRRLSKLARPSEAAELSRARLDMIRAGYQGERALEIFLGLKILLAPLLPAFFLQFNSHLTRPLAFPVDVVIAVWLCGLAFWIPNLILNSKIKERQQDLERALPDAMDLLVTCVEAGLGLDAAMARVSEEMTLAAPVLALELNQTFLEVQAGIPRADSFRRLAERTGVEDLRALAAMLIQTDIFGTSVARALRVHSDGMRVKRMQRAEEKAAMVSVKMTIPLVLCILPSLIAVVMGPAVVMIKQAFGGTP